MESDKAGGLNTFNINITRCPQQEPWCRLAANQTANVKGSRQLSEEQKPKRREVVSKHSDEWLVADIRWDQACGLFPHTQMWARAGDVGVRKNMGENGMGSLHRFPWADNYSKSVSIDLYRWHNMEDNSYMNIFNTGQKDKGETAINAPRQIIILLNVAAISPK